MSGAAGVILTFAARLWAQDSPPQAWLWVASGLCFLYSGYRLWQYEYKRAEAISLTPDGVLYREYMKLRDEIASLRGRRLSDEQKFAVARQIREYLPDDEGRKARSVKVVALGADAETTAYARQFEELLRRAGMTTTLAFLNLDAPAARKYLEGLTVYGRDSKTPATDDVLYRALDRSGVLVRRAEREPPSASGPRVALSIRLGPDRVELLVGNPPAELGVRPT